jgi:hypothetical protein
MPIEQPVPHGPQKLSPIERGQPNQRAEVLLRLALGSKAAAIPRASLHFAIQEAAIIQDLLATDSLSATRFRAQGHV